jgi:predicted aspartyl protease
MIRGSVADSGTPTIFLSIGDKNWSTIVDTGFNGDLELPLALKGVLDCHYAGRVRCELAGGHIVHDDVYVVELPFDGQNVEAHVLFTVGGIPILGTNLMLKCKHVLTVDFVSGDVQLVSRQE